MHQNKSKKPGIIDLLIALASCKIVYEGERKSESNRLAFIIFGEEFHHIEKTKVLIDTKLKNIN